MSRSLSALLLAIGIGACGQGTNGAAPAGALDGGGNVAPDGQGNPGDAAGADGARDAAMGEAGNGSDSGEGGSRPSGIVLGYYADWAAASLPVTAVDWSSVTHVAHAFALPKSGGGLSNGTTLPNDALVQAAHAHGVKVVVSVGGASGDFSTAATTTKQRAATVSALVAFCSQHGYDGIDVDWEFPDGASISSWVALMDDLRTALDAVSPGLSLSSTIDKAAANGDILPAASLAKLTWVGAMTYRYTGGTDAVVGYYAPLQAPTAAEDGSVAGSLQHIVGRGVPASKLLVGLGFYGEEFTDGPPGTPISSPSNVTPVFQNGIVPLVGTAGWKLSWDTTAKQPSLLKGKTWITYEDGPSIDAKCGYAHTAGMAGAMIWHMASGVLDDGSQPLIRHAAGCR